MIKQLDETTKNIMDKLAKNAFSMVLDKIIDSRFDMSIDWKEMFSILLYYSNVNKNLLEEYADLPAKDQYGIIMFRNKECYCLGENAYISREIIKNGNPYKITFVNDSNAKDFSYRNEKNDVINSPYECHVTVNEEGIRYLTVESDYDLIGIFKNEN